MTSRVLAVWFSDLRKWSLSSFRSAKWHWPEEYIKPLKIALHRKIVPVDKSSEHLTSDNFVSVRFGGAVEPRDLDGDPEYKGNLFWAEAGDIIYSKIDCRNGAIGQIPPEFPRVAVTSEFPVYSVDSAEAIGDYVCLIFQTTHFLSVINGMVSGASGRKRVQPEELEDVALPFPPKPIQESIVEYWKSAQTNVNKAQEEMQKVVDDLDAVLFAQTNLSYASRPWLALTWENLLCWDTKNARAAAFRLGNPIFKPLSIWAEEATEIVRPRDEPEKEWPVYGVNNKEGVVFSHRQKGAEFNAAYKLIKKDWFFHNPTRASVGSLGIVPEVPEDAITSPEYQVWRLKPKGLLPDFVAVLIRTKWFVQLIQFHRVGAVKQRLFVENLLEIRIPEFSADLQRKIAARSKAAIETLAKAKEEVSRVKGEVEDMILGIRHIKK